MPDPQQKAGLTEAEINLVRTTLDRLQPDAQRAAELFYGKLFEIAPELEDMFSADMKAQGQKFMATLGVIAAHLGDEARLLPHLRQLARSHDAYGVKPEHFRPMGMALVATLEAVLGDRMPEGADDAWHRVYDRLASEMIAFGAEG